MDMRARLEGSLRYRLLELSRRVHALTARSGFRRPAGSATATAAKRADEFTARLALGLRAHGSKIHGKAPETPLACMWRRFDFRAKDWRAPPSIANGGRRKLGGARRTPACE